MLPTLTALAGGGDVAIARVRERVAHAEDLSSEDIAELLPSGTQPIFTNRVSWAVIYMERAGLLERVRRGVYRILSEGEQLLSRNPARIDMNLLSEYPKYSKWKQRSGTRSSDKRSAAGVEDKFAETPEESFERAARQLSDTLEADLLQRIRDGSPAFFEKVVVDLLIAMGYGRGDADWGQVTGRSGDGGIDGTIKEDALGLDEVYVQAKKYAKDNSVGASDLRNFAGAIDAAGTTKGVFVTTAGFTSAAKDYVARSPKRINLIDGEELVRLMTDYGIGVRTRVRREIKRIDEDFFDQEAQ